VAFADHLTATKRTGGTVPLVDQALDRMPPDEADAARALLVSELSDDQVAQAFCQEGYPMKWGSVRNWRIANRASRFDR